MLLGRSFIVTSVMLFTGCGGGGGSSECNDSVACIQPDPASVVDSAALLGAYDIRYELTSNTCLGSSPLQSLHEKYSAASGVGYHAIPTIEVTTDAGLELSGFSVVGNTDGATFFNVFGIGSHDLVNFIPGMDCVESVSLAFHEIGAGRAAVTRVSGIDCADPGEVIVEGAPGHCEVVYKGNGEFTPTT